ncbi:MAG: hypothetical protein ACXV9R_12405, partial [Methylobacter sp.]
MNEALNLIPAESFPSGDFLCSIVLNVVRKLADCCANPPYNSNFPIRNGRLTLSEIGTYPD